jgi:hypothetical protein
MVSHLCATIRKEQYYCKVISKDTIKTHVTKPDSYRKLIKQLQEDKIIHHTYQMKQERVIRNLHYSIPHSSNQSRIGGARSQSTKHSER